MPKVEISAAHLRRVADALWSEIASLGEGTPARAAVERMLLNDEKMIAAFIDLHTPGQGEAVNPDRPASGKTVG